MDAEEDARERPFLRAIIENPDDDAPRLIFADWLEEYDNGTNGYADRAVFIRIQDRLAEAALEDTQRIDWTISEQVLLDRHCTEWERPLARLGARRVDFRKGFPYGVTMTAKEFLKQAPQFFATAPIRAVKLILDEKNPALALQELQSLMQSPHIAFLRTLDLSGNRIGETGAHILAASKMLRHLYSLNLADNRLHNDGIHALAALDCPKLKELNIAHNCIDWDRSDIFTKRYDGMRAVALSGLLSRLHALDISDNNLHGEGLATLISGPVPPMLIDLNLVNTRLSAQDIGVLAASDNLRTIQILNLSGNLISVSGARALAQSPHISGLKKLQLDRAEIRNEGVQALAACEGLRNLTILSLANNRIQGEGAAALAASPNLYGLRVLKLGNQGRLTDENYRTFNHIFSKGALALATSDTLRQLSALDVSWNSLGPEGGRAFAMSEKLGGLRELNLTGNHIQDEGLIALVDSNVMKRLCILNLSSNRIYTKGVTALAQSSSLRHLTSLDLSVNIIGDDGACCLAESDNMRHLTSINLGAAGIRSAGVKMLAQSKMFANLSTLWLDSNIIEDGIRALRISSAFPKLTTLSLERCHLTDKDVRELSRSTNLSHLATLELSDNNIDPEVLLRFLRSRHFPNLTKLGRERCYPDYRVDNRINELIEQRRTGVRVRQVVSSSNLSWEGR